MKTLPKIIVFTGAGMSAESGLKTFRDSGGLWEEYRIEEVATPQAWEKNAQLVLEFYNKRREQNIHANPNIAHKALVDLESKFDVQIITQNIDDLHERAGSKKVLHLHGEIMKARSTKDPSLVYTLKTSKIKIGDLCEKGSQLRPHIVWFGEQVPEMERAYSLAGQGDIMIVIGTSLNVYPAAGLLDYTKQNSMKYLIDPGAFNLNLYHGITHIQTTASEGVPNLVNKLLKEF